MWAFTRERRPEYMIRKFTNLLDKKKKTIQVRKMDETKGSGLAVSDEEITSKTRVSLMGSVYAAFLASTCLSQVVRMPPGSGSTTVTGGFLTCFWEGCGGGQSELPAFVVFSNSFFSVLLKKKKFFYWHIVALQYCVSFCCAAKWISHTCTYISFLNFLPMKLPAEHGVEFPVLYSRFSFRILSA